MKFFNYLKSRLGDGIKHFLVKSVVVFFLSFLTFYFFGSNITSAATLSFSPQFGTYKVGSIITANVMVSSADKTMNAASGRITFPVDLLSVSSLSKTGSIIDFWAQEPSFSNTDGTINFEGAVLPPWFNGSSGKLLTINFKVKAPGTASVTFSTGSVLAADGSGTDITSSLGNASYNTSDLNQGEPVIMVPVGNNGVPSAPEILSNTHPDQNKWYDITDARFSWGLTKDITGSSLLIARNKSSSPTVLYEPPLSSKEIKDLEDGVWYFSAQLKNDNGWGPVAKFRLQIDTVKPVSFDITEVKRDNQTDPTAQFIFDATDKTSGIDHYEIQIDSGRVVVWKNDGSNVFETSVMTSGSHTLFAKAVDKAGNFLTNSVEFNVQALDAPIITDCPREILSDSVLTVKGITKYPNSQATLFLQDEKGITKEYLSNVDKNGNFTLISSDRLKDGVYIAWAQIMNSQGAKSLLGERITILVKQPAFITIGSLAISFFAILIPLIALILLLAFLLWFAWRNLILGKKRKIEINEAESVLLRTFAILKEDTRSHIRMLMKAGNERELTNKEEKIIRQLVEKLDDAEKIIKKEIKDIEKEVN
jgi:hypothetical protein